MNVGTCVDTTIILKLDRLAPRTLPTCPGCGLIVPISRLAVGTSTVDGLTELASAPPIRKGAAGYENFCWVKREALFAMIFGNEGRTDG